MIVLRNGCIMNMEFRRSFELGRYGAAAPDLATVMPTPAAQRTARPVGGIAKRLMDVTLVCLSAPFLAVIMLGLSLMVWASSTGPVFYGHTRIGFGGRAFKCWKFRTMVTNGDQVLEDYLRRNPDQRQVWLRERKLRDDPRVTPIGAVLRKLSLDELPQLFNVLRGEMSLVGPRPIVADEVIMYGRSAPCYLSTVPGLTGLWQISGRSDTSFQRRVAFDRAYVRNWSALMDLRIILMTVPAVVMARGAR